MTKSILVIVYSFLWDFCLYFSVFHVDCPTWSLRQYLMFMPSFLYHSIDQFSKWTHWKTSYVFLEWVNVNLKQHKLYNIILLYRFYHLCCGWNFSRRLYYRTDADAWWYNINSTSNNNCFMCTQYFVRSLSKSSRFYTIIN